MQYPYCTRKTVFKEKDMNNENANKSIECTVTQCKYHCTDANYCALNTIKVGTHEANPTQTQCVDCESFECKTGACN